MISTLVEYTDDQKSECTESTTASDNNSTSRHHGKRKVKILHSILEEADQENSDDDFEIVGDKIEKD